MLHSQVFCQPIQFRRQPPAATSDAFDASCLFCYNWQPDYFEVDLQGMQVSRHQAW